MEVANLKGQPLNYDNITLNLTGKSVVNVSGDSIVNVIDKNTISSQQEEVKLSFPPTVIPEFEKIIAGLNQVKYIHDAGADLDWMPGTIKPAHYMVGYVQGAIHSSGVSPQLFEEYVLLISKERPEVEWLTNIELVDAPVWLLKRNRSSVTVDEDSIHISGSRVSFKGKDNTFTQEVKDEETGAYSSITQGVIGKNEFGKNKYGIAMLVHAAPEDDK